MEKNTLARIDINEGCDVLFFVCFCFCQGKGFKC